MKKHEFLTDQRRRQNLSMRVCVCVCVNSKTLPKSLTHQAATVKEIGSYKIENILSNLFTVI